MKYTIFLGILFSMSAVCGQTPKLIEQITKHGDELVIPYQKYQLTNGLTVILTEDHSDPIVHVDVTYHVGSAREELGKSGFAHFFEHMMFEGSDHVKSGDQFRIVNASGGSLNGSTNQDRTNYYETIPSNQLEKILWLEADRMGFLLDAVTQRKFENQRSTVKNERGQTYDNRPYGLANEALNKALFPYGHPYSWLTIGNVDDLNKVDVNDLKRFFLRWYGPNNATLTIGGDIRIKQTLDMVQKYFGSIPKGPEITPVKAPAVVLSSDRYISYTDKYAQLPMLYVGYPGVKIFDKDRGALTALSMIIGQGTNGILYKNFVKNRKATSARMVSSNSELAGYIGVQIIPYQGQSLADMQRLMLQSFEQFEAKGVSDEDLTRLKGNYEAQLINGLASIAGKVSSLSTAQTFTGNPNQIGHELDDIRKLTKTDVMRAYVKYIKNKPAVILSILPKTGDIKPAAPDNFGPVKQQYYAPDYGYDGLTYHKPKDNFNRNIMPPQGKNPVVKVPVYWRATTTNGIKLIGTYSSEIPAVSMTVAVRGGGFTAVNDPTKAGLGSLVAQMLNEDTQHFTASEISAKLAVLGSSIYVSASTTEIAFSVSSLTKNVDSTLSLLGERLLHPKFTEEAFERIKRQSIQGLQSAKTQPANVASSVFNKVLFGKDNIRTYGLSGTEQTLNNITLKDVQDFYQNYFSPNLTSVTIVGDLKEGEVKTKLTFLDKWKARNVTVPDPPKPDAVARLHTIYLVDIPHAAQSEIRMGYYTGINFDPTGLYFKVGVTNYILGGAFNSHLNSNLREEKGWTYGAQSGFVSGKYGGYFVAQAAVKSSVTDSATFELVKEIRNYSVNGISTSELAFTKSSIEQSDALRYETNDQKAIFLSRMQQYDLKPDYVSLQTKLLEAITIPEINDLARKYLNPDQMIILIVGDKMTIMPGLQKLGYNLIELDADGAKRL